MPEPLTCYECGERLVAGVDQYEDAWICSACNAERTPSRALKQPADSLTRFRVGGKVPLNVYEGDRPVFQAHTPGEAARLVELLNRALKQPAEPARPEGLDRLERLVLLSDFARIGIDAESDGDNPSWSIEVPGEGHVDTFTAPTLIEALEAALGGK